jgi:hypothetical protein
MRKLFWAAALGGGLYWASKQPGGVSGVWERTRGKVKEIQDSPDPMGTLKASFSRAKKETADQLESASAYTALPDQPATG